MIGRVGGKSLFFTAGCALGQGSTTTLVDRMRKIALALGQAVLGRYSVGRISSFRLGSALVIDNVAGVFSIMGVLQGLCWLLAI